MKGAEGDAVLWIEAVLFGGVPRNNMRGYQQVTDGQTGHGAAALVGVEDRLPEVAHTLVDDSNLMTHDIFDIVRLLVPVSPNEVQESADDVKQ